MTTPTQRRRRYIRQRVDGGLYDVFRATGGTRVGYAILDSDYRNGAWVHRWVGVALTFSGQREYLAPRDSLTAAIADVVAEAEKSPPTHPCRRLPLTVLVTDRETMEAVLASGRRTDSVGRPIHVTARRDMPGRWDIVDGHHRVAEALRCGETEIEAMCDPEPHEAPREAPFYDFEQHRGT